MNSDEFNTYVEDIIQRIRENLKEKAKTDYATKDDRLFNFHSAGSILGSPEKACLAYATKHFLSIAKLVNDENEVSRSLALEKLGDMATYMVIMFALMMEHNQSAQEFYFCTND